MNALTEPQQPGSAEADALRAAIVSKLTYDLGKSQAGARDRDWFMATALAVRDRIVDRWLSVTRAAYESGQKQVYYLSLEFLIGRLLRDGVTNLGLSELVQEALAPLGVDFEKVRQAEPDAALGNGGLGRLAACFMESIASLGIPAFGYGIRYEHGLFRQIIRDGWQNEYPEDWLNNGNPWEYARPEISHDIGFGGVVEAVVVSEARVRHVWHPAETVQAVAYDTPVVGWRGEHVNTLRLWSARAADPLKLDAFNYGDHLGALADRVRQESICKVLYPSDESPAGQELRLKQEYFFASAALQDLVRRHLRVYGDLKSLPDRVAIQLNDTHPAIAVPELMRICVDLHGIPWDEAWEITQGTISYTNHTLLPEALESWQVPLMERLLPRHMQIIYMINAFHLDRVRTAHPDDNRMLSSVSLIEEIAWPPGADGASRLRRLAQGQRRLGAAHRPDEEDRVQGLPQPVAGAGSSTRPTASPSGAGCSRPIPGLTRLLDRDASARASSTTPSALTALRPLAEDAAFQAQFLGRQAAEQGGAGGADPVDGWASGSIRTRMFDVQIKRIHEYKRQLLNMLETVALYDAIRAQPTRNWVPRVKIFAGKAAASYHRAKLIIKLAHDVARVVNSDPTVRNLLKVVFLPNYNVSPRRGRSSPPPICRSRSRPPAWRLPAPAT